MVGAGFAGLAAALDLHDAGVAVTVLEARDRVGGRVRSVQLGNGAVAEMGAEWIMAGDRTLLGLAERFEVPAVATGADYKLREALGPNAASIPIRRPISWPRTSSARGSAMRRPPDRRSAGS